MSDARLRELERLAKAGDSEARATLARERIRVGAKDDLLRSVLEAPEDDLERRALGALLEAAGDPRGQLIAAQCSLADGSAYTSQRPALRAQVTTLLRTLEAPWKKQLGLVGATVGFQRGFVDRVRAPARLLLQAGARLCAAEPVRALELDDCTVPDVEALAAAPWTGRLRALRLRGRIGDDGARALARSSHLGALTTLNLGGTQLGPAGAAALAGSALRLERLALSGNELGDEGVLHLATSPLLARCRALFLARNGLTDAAVPTIVASLAGLETLCLDGNELGPPALEALLASARPTLRRVELGGARSTRALDEALRRRWPMAAR